MPGLCCVPMCNGRSGHKFPANPEEKKRWIHAVKRGELNWSPSKWAEVCRAHFAPSDYERETKEKDGITNHILKPGIVPHIFPWKRQSPSAEDRISRTQKRRKLQDMGSHHQIWTDVANEVEIESELVDDSSVIDVCVETTYVDSCTQTMASSGFSATEYMFDKQRFQFYTGLDSYEDFKTVFYTFGNTANDLTYFYGTAPSMALEDQFFLTLVKLRTARTNFELACMFKTSEKEIANIFITWINFLYFHVKDIDWWPSRELVRFYSPSGFKAKFPTTRAIIDGTEITLKKPKQPFVQQGTYSMYKNRNTVKVLIGVTPGELVSYVSDVYGGAASDRQICERSSLMALCDSADSLMADKGFNVQDLFIPSNVTINIPEFFKKKNRMSATSILKDRKIASKRVYVERLIGLAKTFKILKQPLNNTESRLSDAIVSVCFYLCNFRSAIVPADA